MSDVMFTGLIETIGNVVRSQGGPDNMVLVVDIGALSSEIKIGDSVAVNGACLTAVQIAGGQVNFDVSGETIAKSTMGKLSAGAKVNIELSMRADARFGGHFVLGHVDGMATIGKIENKGRFWDVRYQCSKALLDNMIAKGSVAVDGISLTIAELTTDGFSVAVIPQTWEKTNLQYAKVGDPVNIETDVIVKTVRKSLETILPAKGNLTVEKLKEMGF